MSRASKVNLNAPGVPKYFNHNYLGPGNPTFNGQEVDFADHLAHEHDILYDQLVKEGAKVSKETFNAALRLIDEEYARKFWQSARNGDDDFSYVGAIGLNAKATLEHIADFVLGRSLYPSRKQVDAHLARNPINPEDPLDFIKRLKEHSLITGNVFSRFLYSWSPWLYR